MSIRMRMSIVEMWGHRHGLLASFMLYHRGDDDGAATEIMREGGAVALADREGGVGSGKVSIGRDLPAVGGDSSVEAGGECGA